MFWKKLKTKIFGSRRHIGINLYPTSVCDTGCRHCCDDSNVKNPIHFNKELAETIIMEARKERWDISILLTGGGEPLLCPNLPDIVDIFKSYERLKFFMIITSGFADEDYFRKKQLIHLLKKGGVKKQISQSFSLYHESFPERLRNMVYLMMETNEKSFFSVRAGVSLENFQETNSSIDNIMREIANNMKAEIYTLPVGWFPGDRGIIKAIEKMIDMESFANIFKSEIKLESCLSSLWYVIKTKTSGMVIYVQHISLSKTGRASTINETPYHDVVCDTLQSQINESFVNIGPDGSVYPDCGCYPDPIMRLGRIGEDSLISLIERKDKFSSIVLKNMINDRRSYKWGGGAMCNACKQIAREKGLNL